MTAYLLVAWTMAAAGGDAYAALVQNSLSKAVPAWQQAAGKPLGEQLKSGSAVATIEAWVGPDGSVRRLGLAASSGKNKIDDAVQALVLDAEPFAPPPQDAAASPGAASPGAAADMSCIMRVALTGGKKLGVDCHVACLTPGQLTTAWAKPLTGGHDAAAHLLRGWAQEDAGDSPGALENYRQAVISAPNWDLAARACGLALVRGKRVSEAIPYLKTYVAAQTGAADAGNYAREIARFEAQQDTLRSEAKRVRTRLTQQDIVQGLRKGYALLEPCLSVARQKRALAEKVDSLTLSWKIRKDGSVQAPHVTGPQQLALTEHSECLEQAMENWQFPAYSEGSEISVENVPIKVRGTAPVAPTPVSGAATAAAVAVANEPLAEEATFSACERSPEEIGSYIRTRLDKVQACLHAERRRDPKQEFPEKLPVSFVVDTDGSIRNVRITHRYFREGPLASCVGGVLLGSLSAVGGADCPADFALDLRKAGL